MKVLHLSFTYAPDPIGGTEVYVQGLVRHLKALGIDGAVAAPASRPHAEIHEHEGQPVHRFPAPALDDLRDLFGEGSATAMHSVRRVIDLERPDVVHMHCFTHAVSVLVVRMVRELGLPLVFTYHTPPSSCQRGTLLRYGRIPCDGKVLVTRCSACLAQRYGAGPASWAFAMIPPVVGNIVARAGLRRGAAAALRLTDLMVVRKTAFRELIDGATTVVALSDWVRDLLARNGAPDDKVVLSRQGTDTAPARRAPRQRSPGSPLRAVMLGRLDPLKGLETLVQALAIAPDLDCVIDVFGIGQEGTDEYERGLRKLIAADRRIQLLPPFPSRDAATVIAGYDVLLVPSVWLETGPLVILEAFAAGVPVVGSRLGGISERVRHDIDGLLLPSGDAAAWAATLTRLAADPAELMKLASGIQPPKTMREVAAEMRDVYERATALAGSRRVEEVA